MLNSTIENYGRLVKVLPLFLTFSISLGFVAVVISIAYATFFNLPRGIADQEYYTVLRHTEAGFDLVALADLEDIKEIAPEISWFYVKREQVEGRGPGGVLYSLNAHCVPGNFFDVLGVLPDRGTLTPTVEGSPAVIVSNSLWQSMYGSKEDITEKFLEIENGNLLPIIGVAPPEFTGVLPGSPPEIWIQNETLDSSGLPVGEDIRELLFREIPNTFVFGVMINSTNFDEPLSTLQAVLGDYRFDSTPLEVDLSSAELHARPGGDEIGAPKVSFSFGISEGDRLVVIDGLEINPAKRQEIFEKTTWLSIIVALLLMITLVSFVDFLSAEKISRGNEQMVRIAIGATPVDLILQTVAACAGPVLVVAGLGGLFSHYLSNLLLNISPFSTYIQELPIGARFVGLGVGVLLITTVFLTSVAYVICYVSANVWSISSAQVLRPYRRATRQTLLFVCAVSLLFVFALANRYVADARFSLGFDNTDVLMVTAHKETYVSSEIEQGSAQVLIDAIEAIPGVLSVAAADMVPLDEPQVVNRVRGTVQGDKNLVEIPFFENKVTPDFFSVLGLDVLGGSVFDAVTRNEVTISRTAAEALAGSVEQALGRSIRFQRQMNLAGDSTHIPASTVIGVVEDLPYGNYSAAANRIIYSPRENIYNLHKLLIAHVRDQEDIVRVIQQLRQFDGWDITVVGTPESLFQEQFLLRRSVEIILSAAAAFALILSLVGIAYLYVRTFAEESNSIGIRFALGATPSNVAHVYFAKCLRDIIFVGIFVVVLALAIKFRAPMVANILDLRLLVPVIVCLIAFCAAIGYTYVQLLAKRTSINALVHGV